MDLQDFRVKETDFPNSVKVIFNTTNAADGFHRNWELISSLQLKIEL